MKCYLCDKNKVAGKEYELKCEKGAPIKVCEDCYEDAIEESKVSSSVSPAGGGIGHGTGD